MAIRIADTWWMADSQTIFISPWERQHSEREGTE